MDILSPYIHAHLLLALLVIDSWTLLLLVKVFVYPNCRCTMKECLPYIL